MPNKSSHSDPEIRPPRISEQRASDILLMVLLRPHRLAIILFWRLLGKRVRARGKLEVAIAGLPFAIERMMARTGDTDLATLASSGSSARGSTICVHVHLSGDESQSWAKDALKALTKQTHCPLRILVTADTMASTRGLMGPNVAVLEKPCASQIDGLATALASANALGAQWLVPCATGSTLTPNALAAFCAHAVSSADGRAAHVLYGDTRETPAEPFGAFKRSYWLKPKWDPRMFLSQDYVTAGCALAVEPSLTALNLRGGRKPQSLYELVHRLSEKGAMRHMPRVVAQTGSETWCLGDDVRLNSVRSILREEGTVDSGPYGTAAVRWSLPSELPTVTVVVATRDRLDLLRTCVEGVLHGTSYARLDLIIADNESVEPETLSYMAGVSDDPRVQVVRWPHPFNYSAVNNFAATYATGEYLCLLNNDIEVIEPEWLTEMMREALQPGVGAVGARLLYPDRSIQHAGVAIGIGNAAGHAHRGLPEGDPGYFAQALIARGASAVTAACLLVRKEQFDMVGGLDEEGLAVAYNDVDLCLKLQTQGLRNIYTPLATLIHHESKSRGLDFAPEHLERYMRELAEFQDRWGTKLLVDPWHHPLLDRSREQYRSEPLDFR